MSEPALLQFGNGILSVVAGIFVLGANQKPLVRRPRWWLALTIFFGAAMYLGQFVFALNNLTAGLTRDQARVSLTLNIASTFCFGIAVLSHYVRHCLREGTSALVVLLLLVPATIVDLAFPGWYGLSVLNFLLFVVLAWAVRNEDIAAAMVFLAYACLQVPRRLGPTGYLEFDFSLLVASKFALIGAIYRSLDALQARAMHTRTAGETTA